LKSHGTPDLASHGVLAGGQKAFDAQALLDPFEEQLNLPATLVNRCNGQGRQCDIVVQKDHRLARLWIVEANAGRWSG
jgi:hypothetical protein